jgi:hypothetical protein
MPFFVEKQRRPRALRHFSDYKDFLPEIGDALRSLIVVPDAEAAARRMEIDSELFSIHARGTANQVREWIHSTLLTDHEYARTELSEHSRLGVELRYYLVPNSGFEIRTLVDIGEKGTGNIIWLQVVLRVDEDEYVWWSHD